MSARQWRLQCLAHFPGQKTKYILKMNRDEFFASRLPAAETVLSHLRSNDPCNCTSLLTDEEIRSIYFYTTESEDFSYKPINRHLCGLECNKLGVEHQVDAIDSGLAKLPPFPGNCLRGEDLEGWLHRKVELILKKSKSSILGADDLVFVRNEFFMSVTLNSASAHLDKPVRIVVVSKGGARKINHISAFEDEVELLCVRNSRFLLTNFEFEKDGGRFKIVLAEV